MKSIAFFNNKGGVGKTTIATTVAYELSRQNFKVLVIDLDPQSNTTQVVMSEEQVQKIYNYEPNDVHRIKTIKDVYMPMRDSNEPEIGRVKESIFKSKNHEFKFDLLPSNLSLSEFEDTLSDAWSDLRANKLGGFRRTNWFIQLQKQVESKYDYIILDLSPSLGALNRSVLLNVDNFVIPITGDIYNVYGVKNIGEWIQKWITTYKRSLSYLEDDYDNSTLSSSQINMDITSENYQKFLGYIVSRAKKSKTTKNIISYQEKHIEEIENMIFQSLKFSMNPAIPDNNFSLGVITEIISLLTESQGKYVPPYKRAADSDATNKKWEKGSPENAEYGIMKTFEEITEKLLDNIERIKKC